MTKADGATFDTLFAKLVEAGCAEESTLSANGSLLSPLLVFRLQKFKREFDSICKPCVFGTHCRRASPPSASGRYTGHAAAYSVGVRSPYHLCCAIRVHRSFSFASAVDELGVSRLSVVCRASRRASPPAGDHTGIGSRDRGEDGEPAHGRAEQGWRHDCRHQGCVGAPFLDPLVSVHVGPRPLHLCRSGLTCAFDLPLPFAPAPQGARST